jgi:hypothetical protein
MMKCVAGYGKYNPITVRTLTLERCVVDEERQFYQLLIMVERSDRKSTVHEVAQPFIIRRS